MSFDDGYKRRKWIILRRLQISPESLPRARNPDDNCHQLLRAVCAYSATHCRRRSAENLKTADLEWMLQSDPLSRCEGTRSHYLPRAERNLWVTIPVTRGLRKRARV